jgi:hypothetical protein
MEIKRVTDKNELLQVSRLQIMNLKKNITEEAALTDGFLTAEYTMEYLQQMHDSSPSIIAKDGDQVVGYALVATKAVRDGHDLMADLFNVIDTKFYNERSLREANYVVVGQLCVAKDYRCQGLVKGMYDYYRDCYAAEYEYLITDVAQANTRSLKAHKKSGFIVIDTLEYGGIGWDIVLWDWRQ